MQRKAWWAGAEDEEFTPSTHPPTFSLMNYSIYKDTSAGTHTQSLTSHQRQHTSLTHDNIHSFIHSAGPKKRKLRTPVYQDPDVAKIHILVRHITASGHREG
ncbi:hypothetical protein Pcinc_013406 [Petrolisthes cinctipes]|uniref:Uncharacterized protein n=1 Tax=Petrolisthes cinctipes TaxID=88211 RepID=A0AAE1KSR5_PETCI|nr:hypothetical protein Pcinc_013406 [Petrolisthes cinctipes]